MVDEENGKELTIAQIHVDLERIKSEYPGVYTDEVFDTVAKNADKLIPLYKAWDAALHLASDQFDFKDYDSLTLPVALENSSLNNEEKSEKPKGSKTVIAFAGPGASGKGTIQTAFGAPRITATTTRPRRDYEVPDVDYHFVSQVEYQRLKSEGSFVYPNHKPNRGNYGIQKTDIDNFLAAQNVSIVEENPEGLIQIGKEIQAVYPDVKYKIAYILPPGPVLPTLALRLATRSLVSGLDYATDIDSTLGLRQVKEFEDIVKAKKEGTDVIFVVNDKVERATQILKDLTN
jgi:guanylate kinase